MNLKLSNEMYDFLNALVRIILPGAGTAYFGLAEIWGLPRATEVVGSIVVITTFLGVVILLARKGWKVDDELLIDDHDPNQIVFGFKSGAMMQNLEHDKTLNLKVKRVDPGDPKVHYDEDGIPFRDDD